MTIFNAQKGNSIKNEAPAERIQSPSAENGAKADGGEGTSCPQVVTETSSSRVSATPIALESAVPVATPMSREPLQSSQAEDTTAVAPSQPAILTKEAAAKKELQDLLREMYVKYPSAQDDDQVESMVLLLKASLLSGEQERVRELKTELKLHLIINHG
jgi:hypothetical protein